MRPIAVSRRVRGLFVFLLVALTAPARAADLRHFEDAALRAVQFVDAKEGWAVGDEGVIWHTIDGGKTWERQPSGVRGSLRSLHFLNPFTGWVAGREELPGGAGSSGILLYTKDGGETWQRILVNSLPGLNVVRIVNPADPRLGYLAGDASDQYPTGVFVTQDGGRTWQPLLGPRATSWLAADFAADGSGALAGAWNRLATVRKERVNAVDMDALGGRNLRGLVLQGRDGIAVGQGGLVMQSRGSSGTDWNFTDLKLPDDVRAGWDFHAVAAVGTHYWVVGRPGSVMLHSPDHGGHWEMVRTGQALPLDGIYFQDDQHGWAVGELGTIVATADGGRTWRVQRRGGERAAVLFVHARAAGTPLDTVAYLGGVEGYLTAALQVTSADSTTSALTRAAEGLRFATAVRLAGGAAAESLWQFPVGKHLLRADRKDLVASWDRLHGDRGAEQLLRQLVLALRTWRPSVIVTDHPDPAASGQTADVLVAEAVAEAFKQAGDPKAFPEQIAVLGLEPWKAAKAYARWDGRPGAPVMLDLTAVHGRLEGTLADFAAGPLGLVTEGPVPLPARRLYRLLADNLPGAANQRDLMEGVALARGGLARRPQVLDGDLSPEMDRAIKQRRALKTLAENQATGLTDPDKLLAQIAPMLGGMPDDQAAAAAHAVAGQYVRLGQWNLAREAYLLMANRYPNHPLTADALRWLIRYNSSSEARRRYELGQFQVVRQQAFNVPKKNPDRARKAGTLPQDSDFENRENVEIRTVRGEEWKMETKPGSAPGRELLQFAPVAGKQDYQKWYQGALDLEPRLAAFGPLYVGDPSVQFCLQAARRNLGDAEGARKWYSHFVARQPDGPWRAAALAELWLFERKGPPPKSVAACRLAEARPYLDGQLDDDCWQGPPLRLRDASGETSRECPTEVRLAYDREFLYLSARCVHPAGTRVEPEKERRRDADLRGHDRISLLLDLDRDYATCFHLQIDQRGCVHDDCWGDKTWDPRWFVAVRDEETSWTVEAAIPLAALTGDGVLPGKAWGCNVVRVLPGRGVQAWSLPAEVPEEVLRPEGLGLLLFAEGARQTAAQGERKQAVMPTAR
jgi:photosystem II stability/assembly factor-like uncharacterized protein/tetratricopeptide (TPR) repeat protein